MLSIEEIADFIRCPGWLSTRPDVVRAYLEACIAYHQTPVKGKGMGALTVEL